jgi:U4/U6 small nuclear ribonucleoprotein PRP3
MVYVEGAAKFIRKYKRLMLERIAWTEAARPRGAEDVDIDNGDLDEEDGAEIKTKGKIVTQDEAGEVVPLDDNKCFIIWEGQLRDRAFNSFKPRSCPTDSAAKELLGARLSGYWDQAKNWKPEEEELF